MEHVVNENRHVQSEEILRTFFSSAFYSGITRV
jgi:hypothetical protein